jgi:hypothetical protein
MKKLKILLNPLFWLAVFIFFAFPFEMFIDSGLESRWHTTIAIFRIHMMSILWIPFALSLVWFAFLAIKKRFFTTKIA